ncbi:MAG: ATP-binding protein, partial [Flavobacteriales bacterium]
MLFITSIIAVLALAGSIFLIIRNRKVEAANKKIKKESEDIHNTLVEQERYLAYTSHEIRTPLNAIAGGAHLISKTELDDKQKKYLTAIRSGVDSALLIVNDILDLSKIDSNMVEVHPVDFMITEVMNGVRNILQYRTDQKGIELQVHIDEKIPPVIKGDAKHLNQILLNLSTNAVKFTDLGKVEIRADFIEEKEEKVYLRFSVIDSGKGIRKSNLATIFNQYEQESRHTIKHAGGTGLGLAITKKLVEMQGGKISVDSQYLQGTTFQVELSYGKSDPQVLRKENTSAETAQKLDKTRVLLVDDNVINREILFDLLKDLNSEMEITVAENGETAVNKLYSGNFDIVLMDIQMPKMNGFEATVHIR